MKVGYLCLQATREGQASHAHVHEIINGLENRGIQVDLYEPKYASREVLPGAFGRFYGCILTQLKLIISIKNYDLIYIRAHYLSFITTLFSKILKRKTILEINGPINDGDDIWPIIRLFKKFLYKVRLFEVENSNGVIAVTPNLKEEILDINNNVRVIPNGANTKYFSPMRKAEEINISEPYVVFVGAMAKWQGIDRIIKAVKSEHWPIQVKMIFIGDGIDKKIIEEASLIHKNIVYLGRKPYKEVGSYVANSIANLAVISGMGSRGKIGASPLKLFEGMASGVPIIATDIGYMGDLVRDINCGLVVSSNYEADELAKSVKFLFENKNDAKKFGINGREAIMKYHSWDKRAEDTHKLMIEITNK